MGKAYYLTDRTPIKGNSRGFPSTSSCQTATVEVLRGVPEHLHVLPSVAQAEITGPTEQAPDGFRPQRVIVVDVRSRTRFQRISTDTARTTLTVEQLLEVVQREPIAVPEVRDPRPHLPGPRRTSVGGGQALHKTPREVPHSALDEGGRLSEVTEHDVAPRTEQTSDSPRHVVMIDVHAGAPRLQRGSTNGAFAALSFKDAITILGRDPVPLEVGLTQPCANFSWILDSVSKNPSFFCVGISRVTSRVFRLQTGRVCLSPS